MKVEFEPVIKPPCSQCPKIEQLGCLNLIPGLNHNPIDCVLRSVCEAEIRDRLKEEAKSQNLELPVVG